MPSKQACEHGVSLQIDRLALPELIVESVRSLRIRDCRRQAAGNRVRLRVSQVQQGWWRTGTRFVCLMLAIKPALQAAGGYNPRGNEGGTHRPAPEEGTLRQWTQQPHRV
jgi:hypothetical protein